MYPVGVTYIKCIKFRRVLSSCLYWVLRNPVVVLGLYILLLLLFLYLVHILGMPLHVQGTYIQEYMPIELNNTYDRDYIIEHFKDYRKFLSKYYDISYSSSSHKLVFDENFCVHGPLEGFSFCAHVDCSSTLDPKYYSGLILEIEHIMTVLNCPVHLESHPVEQIMYDFLFCAVPLEVLQSLISYYRAGVQGVKMPTRIWDFKETGMYSTEVSTSYSLAFYLLLLLLCILVCVLVLSYLQFISVDTAVHTVSLVLILIAGVALYYYEAYHISLFNDIHSHKHQLREFGCSHPLPNYKEEPYYGLQHIFGNMSKFCCLKHPLYGHHYVINPRSTLLPNLNEHFIKCVPLGHIKGLVTFEGFPLYVKDGRLYVQVPLNFMVQLEEALGQLSEGNVDPKYRRPRDDVDGGGFMSFLKRLIRGK